MIYRFNQCTLDTEQYQLKLSDTVVATEPLVFDLLVYLIEHHDRVVSRVELLENLWKGKVVTDAALGARLKDVRKAVGDSGSKQSVIKTLHGRGYQFVAEVQPAENYPASEASVQSGSVENPALPEIPSIAVLPFKNLSSDPEQEFFSDGITEDITTALSHFSGLFVIARNSAFSYKGQVYDIRKVASELGVRYLLEGSVRRSGKQIRIGGQLINAFTGDHLWAERFDGDLTNLFELQDEITRRIVGSIAPQIEMAEVERGRSLQPASLNSYELSLKAKSQAYDSFRSGDASILQTAIDTANSALKLDPRNSNALWILGNAYMEQYTYQWGDDPIAAIDRSFQIAEKLIHVDSLNSAGYILRGDCYISRREFDLAIDDYEYGISLNPNAALHLIHAAWGESLAGFNEKAIKHAKLALRLSPKEMDLFLGIAYLGLLQASFAEGDYSAAMKWGRLSIQMHGRAPIRRAMMIACCGFTNALEEARQHTLALNEFSPDFLGSLTREELRLYRNPKQNELLREGIRLAGGDR